jgi:hypothetical protein
MALTTPRIALLIILFSATFVFRGCSSSSDTDEPLLNQAISLEIFNYLMAELMFVGFDYGKYLPDQIEFTEKSEPAHITVNEYSATVSCGEGGSLSQTGSVTSNLSDEGTGTVETTLTQSISDCAIGTSQGLFVVNGNPNLKSWGSMNVVSWQPTTFAFTFEGGYTWEGAGITGDCSMEISYSINLINPGNFSMSGHMCGYNY